MENRYTQQRYKNKKHIPKNQRLNLVALTLGEKIDRLRNLKKGQIAIVASMPLHSSGIGASLSYVNNLASEGNLSIGNSPRHHYFWKLRESPQRDHTHLIIGRR